MSARGQGGVWLVTGALVVLSSALLLGLDLQRLPLATPPFVAPVWVFALAFAATEHFVIHLHRRRDAHSLSMSELPLLLGYSMLGPIALIGARLLGSAFTLGVLKRQELTKLALNLALFAAEATLGLLIFRSVLNGHAPLGPRAWAAAVLSILATNLLGTVSVSSVIWLTEGRVQLGMLRQVVSIGSILAIGNAALGAFVLGIAWTAPAALPPLAAVTAFLYVGYRAYLSLRERHANLQTLYQFTSATARSGDTRDAAAAMLDEVCQLLRCDIAEFVLVGEDGRIVLRMRQQDGLLLHDDDLPVASPAAVKWCLARVSGGPALFPHGKGPHTALTHYLADVPVKDAVLASLDLELVERLRGVITAANRSSQISTFDEGDAQLVGALARHAGVALENGQLVERLRHEAADKARQASHDSLTQLPNRTLLQRELGLACDRSRRDGSRFAVLLLDLDNFKQVNDTLGHGTGDLLLQEVAARLQRLLRPGDIVSRLGGDEFALLVADVDDDGALAIADRITAELQQPCVLHGIAVDVRASIGVALCPDHATDPDNLMQRADVTMYAAKAAGGRPRLYDPSLDVFTHRRLALAAELRTALNQGALEVHYQPRVRLADGMVTGVEALARWTHPEFGSISPQEFIPIAEETGLIDEVTRIVLARAIADATRWHCDGQRIGLSVNIAARSVMDQSFPSDVAEVLQQTAFPGELLTLEVTESSMLTDPARAVATLEALAAMGVRLAIDDFGTGFSSMAYLKRLPLHEIKVDQGFVRHMLSDENDRVIVQSIVDLAHNLGMACVAEGVEDDDTVLALMALGCEEAQGYLWSRPLPADELLAWLGNSTPSLREPQVLRDSHSKRDRRWGVRHPGAQGAMWTR
ncbi:putative bifunctional diguanylate cyclase/phosphodiesterase [Euzebya rosea]|uniref:putative bifunctional diguanylate cyclase/phosphodiesterase n=1 Tax=Euzebya rosea TaxID=2052804 RepID=UPI0013004A2B|nr:EAL domain-containing protein [Euzebya rosea]